MNVELNCTIDDKTILDKFKNIKIVLGIETKYNKESSDEYLLFYPVEDEVEVNVDSEFIEPNIIYSNSNLQIFFNKDNPYYYHMGRTHHFKETIFVGWDTALYNLFKEVLSAKGWITGNEETRNIIVTREMRTAIKDTEVIFDVGLNKMNFPVITNVNVVG